MQLCRDNVARMAGYMPGEQPRVANLIKLNTNENPYPPSPRVAEALRAAAPESLRLYPDPGASALRREACSQFGFESPDWAMAGNGSDDLLTIAVRTYVNQGGALACPNPTYSLYPVLAAIQGARTVRIPLDEGFAVPANLGRRAAAEGATLLFLARPNAPTGLSCPLDTVRRICREFPGLVWIDEAYAAFAEDHCLDLVREFWNVAVSRTFSKSHSLAGIRLGLVFAQPEQIEQMGKVRDSYNVNAITQALGMAALRDPEYLQHTVTRVKATRQRLTAELERLGCVVVPSQANFVFTRPPRSAAGVMHSLRERGIVVRYFPAPATAGFLRITVGTDEQMDRLVRALQETLTA